MPPARNLVNLKDVSKAFASRPILVDVTLGVQAGERIGVVGVNGGGKSTLLRLIAGLETPDSGAVTHARGTTIALLDQHDDLDPEHTLRQELIGDRADHEWAGDAAFRDVLDGMLGGVELSRFPQGLDTPIGPLSGGERRRIALAKALIDKPELLLLDEPTNHLDVEGVDWLARHLTSRRGSLLVVTHDRWFLDAVCLNTWEVADGSVHQYDGGYAAYVLARAERDRQDAARETRRRALIRKELAWLRRGPPARTTKPKFRVEAANDLIAGEPPPRNSVQLLQFATARLGKRVIDAINVSIGFGDSPLLLNKVTWRLAPGDRIGLVGVNGAGKSTLLKLLAGELEPGAGSIKRGQTVRVAKLTQELTEINEQLNVFEALEDAKIIATLSEGREITSKQLCDRFGFGGGRARTPVGDLSGGERRRLELMRLMMGEPNVLLLDEPTNDLDIDTLTALEDLLDNWPGTLIVVSHDRYFVERVCDNIYGLLGDGTLRHMGGGIEQYVRLRREQLDQGQLPGGNVGVAGGDNGNAATGEAGTPLGEKPSGAALHAARKEVRRADQALKTLAKREEEMHARMEEAATDHERLAELTADLAALHAERERLEAVWLENSELLER